ncbi:MAG: hypothetical protein ACJ72N_10060 [Labedaea sp.]
MPTAPASQLIEIACDESGAEGENLIGGETDVFAHASVSLSDVTATNCVQEIRELIGSPAQEYKSNHLLRTKHRPVLEWLLGPNGPISGNAHVYLIDKTFFAVGKLTDLLVAQPPEPNLRPNPQAAALARTLYRDGPGAFGRGRWAEFLESFTGLMRVRNRRGVPTSVDGFFRMVDTLRAADAGTSTTALQIMDRLWQARPRLEAFRAQLLDNPNMIPALDPLIPALAGTVAHWSAGERAVAIVHDQQTALTDERVAELKEMFGRSVPQLRGRLRSLRLVDSRTDARVQVADFLAGVARKIASEELNDRGDVVLTGLLRPYVDALSIWGDDRSWLRLADTGRGG